MIHIQLEKHIYALGEAITGSCEWIPDGDEKSQRAILIVGWRTEGRGSVDTHSIHEMSLQPSRATDFICNISPKEHPSYDGELLRIIWEVRVDVTEKKMGVLNRKKEQKVKRFQVTSSS